MSQTIVKTVTRTIIQTFRDGKKHYTCDLFKITLLTLKMSVLQIEVISKSCSANETNLTVVRKMHYFEIMEHFPELGPDPN